MNENNKSESTELKDLVSQHEILSQKVKDMHADFDEVNSELKTMDEIIADAQSSERSKMINKRGLLIIQKDALAAALKILRHRKDVAYLAIYEFAEYKEKCLSEELHGKSTKISAQINQAMLDLQRFINSPNKNSMSESDRDVRRIKLETNLAKLKAESSIAHRDAVRAGYALEHARKKTEAIRQELGIQD